MKITLSILIFLAPFCGFSENNGRRTKVFADCHNILENYTFVPEDLISLNPVTKQKAEVYFSTRYAPRKFDKVARNFRLMETDRIDWKANAVSDLLIKSIKHLGSDNPPLSFDAWVHTLILNSILAEMRKKSITPQWSLVEDSDFIFSQLISNASTPESMMIQRQLRERVLTAIKKIKPEIYQQAFVLRYYFGYSQEEIMKIQQAQSLGAVKTRIHRGLDSFKKHF